MLSIPPANSGLAGRCVRSITVPANSTVTLAEIDGPGAIQHIWITTGAGVHASKLVIALLLGR